MVDFRDVIMDNCHKKLDFDKAVDYQKKSGLFCII